MLEILQTQYDHLYNLIIFDLINLGLGHYYILIYCRWDLVNKILVQIIFNVSFSVENPKQSEEAHSETVHTVHALPNSLCIN